MDEADRLLTLDLKKRLNIIIEKLPQERTTFLFSATMTNKVEKLKTACLKKDAVKIEIN